MNESILHDFFIQEFDRWVDQKDFLKHEIFSQNLQIVVEQSANQLQSLKNDNDQSDKEMRSTMNFQNEKKAWRIVDWIYNT